MSNNLLSPDVIDRIREIGNARLLIGISTYNNANTIEHVVKSVVAGLTTSFPNDPVVIVNCDGGSQDETPKIAEVVATGQGLEFISVQHPLPTIQVLDYCEHGVPGYENAVRTIFHIAGHLDVHACTLIHGNLRSITPEWMGLLFSPITQRSFDVVAPLFTRHKFEGSLTNSIVYPLNRALYGKQVRYHGGGGYGLSGKLASLYLSKEVWGGDVAHWGIENWMTAAAIAEGYEVCQATLGPKVQETTSGVDLSVLFSHVVGAVFDLMEEYETVWEGCQGSSAVPIFGAPFACTTTPLQVNRGRMVKGFRQGLRDLLPLWENILSPETMAQVLPLGLLDVEEFTFPIEIWVQVIYDFALAYHQKTIHRDHLLKALTPLYLGRTASFILETVDSNAQQVEHNIELLCQEYEAQKLSFRERWR